jgi:hypothetical protein
MSASDPERTQRGMARRTSDEVKREYVELNAFVDMYATYFRKIDPGSDAHPTNVGKRIVAAVGFSKALVGLRQAVNDCLEGLQDLSPLEVQQLDTALRQSGIVTLTELRRRHCRKYKAVLKRGAVRSETEYYMVKAVLDERTDALSETEVATLGDMLVGYETTLRHHVRE